MLHSSLQVQITIQYVPDDVPKLYNYCLHFLSQMKDSSFWSEDCVPQKIPDVLLY